MTNDHLTQDDAVARFVIATLEEPALAAELEAVVGNRSVAQAEDDIVAFARSRGFDFDTSALRRIHAQMAAQAQADGARDLSDDALESVSGGFWPPAFDPTLYLAHRPGDY